MSTDVIEGFPALGLTEGGPGEILLRRLRLAPLAQRSRRAAIVLAGVTWIPLLVLSAIEHVALGGVRIPFLYDLGVHVRFLVAVPVLVLAEVPIGMRVRQVTARFVEAGLIRKDEQPRFVEIIRRTLDLRDSRVAELLVLAAACAATYGVLANALQAGSTWHTPKLGSSTSVAGLWYGVVSLPIFQFLLFRWVYRMGLWARLLHQLSTLDLHLTPTHPDGAGGVGFLGKVCVPFGSLLFALSAVASSAIATRILFEGASLQNFEVTYAVLVILELVIFSGPLLVLAPTLARVRRTGLREYGTLASRYMQLFDRKWVKDGGAPEELLGTADIQSLADLANSYELVKKMRVVPIELSDFIALTIPAVIPALPLAATVMPVSEILKDLVRLLR
jgi:hypothetical protein